MCLSGYSWLLVLDNIDNIDVLVDVWPGSSGGCILLTSRNLEAFTLASNGLQVQPFDFVTGSAALLDFLKLDPESESNKQHASAICSAFGGLPLALHQMAEFMLQRKIPIQDFLPLYNRNYQSINVKAMTSLNYGFNLASVWDKSLKDLQPEAHELLKIMAFLNPDNICESLVQEGASKMENPRLEFAKDEIK